MNAVTLSLMETREIGTTFTKRFFDLQKFEKQFANRHNESLTSLQKLVQPVVNHIAKGEVSKCDAAAFSLFLEGASQVTRLATQADAYGRNGSDNVSQPPAVMDCCVWLCSLSAAGSASSATRLRIAGAWIYANLVKDSEIAMEVPQSYLNDLVAALAPLKLVDADLSVQARTEFVVHASKRLASGKLTSEESTSRAKEWCGELVAVPPFGDDLKEAAKTLNVPIPMAEKSSEELYRKPRVFTPNVFAALRQIPQENQQIEWEECLIQLLGIPKDEVLAKDTARRVGSLTPETSHIEAADAMDLAAWDIWQAYWRNGDEQGLNAARQFAEFAYAVLKTQGVSSRQRADLLHLILNLQLPELLRRAALGPIREEAGPLMRAEGCICNTKAMLAGMVQAVAGSCHAAERINDRDDRDTLLTLHGEQLRQIHREYERLARDHTGETEAWMYLAPLIAEIIGDDDNRPKMDPNLVRLVNRGNHSDVLTYITNQLEQYRSTLEQKLTRHRLSGDHLMRPSGKLTTNQGGRPMLLPAFETGLRLLKASEFARAAAEFEEIASRRIGVNQQNISRDYQAYSLAREDKFIQAKPLLRGLCDSNYRFSSAYWNLACIETERQDQLAALVLGLERAPHLNMLEGAVYLGVIVDRRTDDQVCHWLSLMPFIEALMLQYHHESLRLEEDEKGRRKRDDLLKRISSYIQYGDPEVPDPTNAKIPPGAISDLRDSLKQRDHLEVIGFWFQCHRPYQTHFKDNRAKTDYYVLRTDIFNDLGQPDEAAATFQEEMDCHLIYLSYILRNEGPNRISARLLHDIRSRLERQLRICMAPDLEPVGRRLYRGVQEWENQFERSVVLISDAPPLRKIHEFYSGGVETLERVLIRVSGELRKSLHDTKDYPRQRAPLMDLLRALETASKHACAKALRDQMETWDQLLQTASAEGWATAALDAQAAYNPLLGSFEQHLTLEQLEMANGILHAIKRVNGRHTPGPKVLVTAVSDAAPEFRGNGQISAFSLRATTEKGSHEARLINAIARMQDTGHAFRLRDNLDVLPVLLRPDQSTLLSFEDDGVVRATGACELEVELTYEHLGQTLQTPALKITVETTSHPKVTIKSPYVFGRELYLEEIEGRFFGREEEQRTILELLTGTSNKIGYIEGIRKTGKTSLFNSVRYELSLKAGSANGGGPKLILVHLNGGSVGVFSQVGLLLHHFLSEICREPQVAAAGVVLPEKDTCRENMLEAYRQFESELRERLPDHRVVAFWDDFQTFVNLAEELALQNQSFLVSARAFLNVIRDERRANSHLVWLLSGFRSWLRFITQVPNVNLWAELEPIPIDFLGIEAVRDILVMPLQGTPMVVTPEAVARVYEYTQGHPDTVQRLAASMLARAQRENRCTMTPADADAGAQEISETQGVFADTWCPLGELSSAQRMLISSFINVVKQPGGYIEPHRLIGTGAYTDRVKKEVDDLVARKMLTRQNNGTTVKMKAPVLEMWIRNHWKDEEPPLTAAVFIDLANLTEGTGSDTLELPGLSFGDVLPGTFKLKTVLDAIDSYAADLVPTPVTEKWAVNYPPGSRAVPILNLNSYQVINMDKGLYEKGRRERGSDDVTLISKIAEITSDRPAITHVVLVTGDKDLKIVGVELQLNRGKSVHILTRQRSTAGDLIRLASLYPQKCKLVYIEDLLTRHHAQLT